MHSKFDDFILKQCGNSKEISVNEKKSIIYDSFGDNGLF